jgi:hypothetical protein
MQHTADHDSRSPPRGEEDPAKTSLTSGYGAVIEKEQALQASTGGTLRRVRGDHSNDVDRILRQQHSCLGANIALLEQRSEALPKPARFVNWQNRERAPLTTERLHRSETEMLQDLNALHIKLLADIETLISCAPGGQRSELILAEISHNHEEMAWMLTALLKEKEAADRGAVN